METDPAAPTGPAPGPPGYPARYEVDVALSDGSTVHVRPILPDDADLLLAFHLRQSPESIYFRYFSPRPHLTESDLAHLTTVDYVDRMALVAVRGDELVGVARYDRWEHRSEAEVAFFIDDRHHGLGMATVLLEHLAARAGEVGIAAFTASVLPDNRKMIGVFTSAGFTASTRFADGVVEVRLGLLPTPEAKAAIEARARGAAAKAVQRLLAPTSVAVIGAGRTEGTIGHDTFRNLVRGGFEGPVWPVNPEAHHVASVRAVATIEDIADPVDLAIVAVPAPAVPETLEACGRKDVAAVVVLSSGFAEAGPEGEALEAESLLIARRWGFRLLGPNCLGLLNTHPEVRLHGTFAAPAPLAGPVALLSESGMIGAAIVDQARELGVGISSFVALGNRADVSGNDLLQHWELDERTRVVCMYIESFGNPRHFSRTARRLTRVKPVVAVKAGQAPGSTAGSVDLSEEALLRQTGVIRVPTLAALLDTARLLVHQPLPAGPRVAVVGNAGGSMTLAADACLTAGLQLADLSEPTLSALSDRLPTIPEPGAPVDIGLQADREDLTEVLAQLAGDPAVDSMLVLFAPSLGATADEAADALAAVSGAHPDVTVAACFYGPHRVEATHRSGARVPIYRAVDEAARALGRVCGYARWLELDEGSPVALSDHDAAGVRAMVAPELAGWGSEGGPHPLGMGRAFELLDSLGIVVTPTHVVEGLEAALAAAADIGYPVVLKSLGRDRLAKTVAAGLALDLADEGEVRSAWTRMEDRLGEALVPVAVQPMEEPGLDVAVTVEAHPVVGPVLSVSHGGVAAALEPARDVRVLPLTDRRAQRLVEQARVAELLDEGGRAHLLELLLRVGALVESVPQVVELDLNPILVRSDAAVVADAEVRVAAVDLDPLPPIRRIG
jgi:acyl-CoA synthetase (NDP forming)/RimJ/RimL family protein N-acetyltransferase